MRTFSLVAGLLLLIVTPQVSDARTWTSAVGGYTLDAEVISFNDTTVVLKKKLGDLVAVELSELSETDREFVKSKSSDAELTKSIEVMQTWTSAEGKKIRARVLAFGRKKVVVSRQRGKAYFNDKEFGKGDPLHQTLVLKILSKLEGQPFETEHDLTEWTKGLGGASKTYTLEGVLMQLESGDEIGVPFFLFSKDDLKVLQPGWNAWVQADSDHAAQQRESLMVQSEAMEYQRNEMQHRQVELLKLNMMAVATGVTSIWEVSLRPGAGVYGRPTSVMVTASDSLTATNMATAKYPGYTVAYVRRASGY